jgi:hypothetical protein
VRVNLRPGTRLLWVALICLGLTCVATFTPIVWIITGYPTESYPELFFALYVLPVAMLFVVIAAANFWRQNRRLDQR